MGKQTILVFWLAGLVFTVVGVFLIVQISPQELQAPVALQSPLMIPGGLLLVANVANFIAWVGALVLLGRLGAWGWFVEVFLLGSLGLLIFLIFGPDEYIPENDYGDYGDYGDHGAPV